MAETLQTEYNPVNVSHPGGTLADVLEERGISQADLSLRISRPKKVVNEMVNGKARITPETALRLERALGVPASFWNNRQRQYDEWDIRQKEQQRLNSSDYVEWLKHFPVKEMMKFGYIPQVPNTPKNRAEIVGLVLDFFGVASPDAYQHWQEDFAVQYRRSSRSGTNQYALSAWLRKGLIEAQRLRCESWDKKRFTELLPTLKRLSVLPSKEFAPKLKSKCKECGVAVVFVPELPGMKEYGACYWHGETPVIQLCLRGKKNDVLWFNCHHEAAHIVLHAQKRRVFLDGGGGQNDPDEVAANDFAGKALIPAGALEQFVSSNPMMSEEKIKDFARKLKIDPSIVVGQLHHNGYVPYTHFQGLRRTLNWER